MNKLPYCLYSASFPPGSLRRIGIALFIVLATLITTAIAAFIFHTYEGFQWLLLLITIGYFLLGKAWMNRVSHRGLNVLRFDRDCQNFQFVRGKEIISFRAEEARLLKTEDDENHFEVRGIPLSFPVRVYSIGNFRTALYLSGTHSILLAIAGRFSSSRAFSFVVNFENGALKVWGETLSGERCK